MYTIQREKEADVSDLVAPTALRMATAAARKIDTRIDAVVRIHAPRRYPILMRFRRRWLWWILGVRVSTSWIAGARHQRWVVRIGRVLRTITVPI